MEKALEPLSTIALKDIRYVVATGYGRVIVPFAHREITEISCHARGAHYFFPTIRTILDMGGQDCKAIKCDSKGKLIDFVMNDKCAAGTGRFLEVLTERILDLPLEALGSLSLQCKNPCTLSSVCTVFAESEIISLLSENRAKEDIACGIHKAIAKRVISMGTTGLINYSEPIVFSGGVARNIGVVKAIEEELGKEVTTPEEPQITAALGAALFAKEYSK